MSTLTVGMVVVGLQLILGPQVAALFAHIITGGKTQSIIRMVGPSDQLGQTSTGVEGALLTLAEVLVVLLHRLYA